MPNDIREWKQLNNIPEESLYIEFPLAFTGKLKNGKATVFTGVPLSAQFILSEIHTMNKISKEPAKLTYEHFIQVFGMSKETVCTALSLLKELDIVEVVKQSRYRIKAYYNKNDYVEVDRYWLKREWDVNGQSKRFARSRILTLALVKRGVTNPKTNGEFISSQARIGVAINLPRTTAGDSVRELVEARIMQTEKQDGNDKRKRGCSKYFVNPQILEVKHPNMPSLQAVQALFNVKPSAEDLHNRLMGDIVYKDLNERISLNKNETVTEIIRTHGDDSERLVELEAERGRLREELERYFKEHRINRAVFPNGFFPTDIIESEAN